MVSMCYAQNAKVINVVCFSEQQNGLEKTSARKKNCTFYLNGPTGLQVNSHNAHRAVVFFLIKTSDSQTLKKSNVRSHFLLHSLF